MSVISFSSYQKERTSVVQREQAIFLERMKQLGHGHEYERCAVCSRGGSGIELYCLDGRGFNYENIVPLCLNHCHDMKQMDLRDVQLEKVQYFLWHISNSICPF